MVVIDGTDYPLLASIFWTQIFWGMAAIDAILLAKAVKSWKDALK